MYRTQLSLLAFMVFSSVNYLADGSPLQVMSAPNLLRVGTAENIFVECQDCTGGDMRVDIIVMNHPTKARTMASTSVTLTSANNFQQLAQITIPVADFSKDPSINQYVYLQAQFPDKLLEKVVLVSFQSGYIFIQTDKSVYTPSSSVHYRMFAVTHHMTPVGQEAETRSDAVITIEIVTPEGVVLPQDPVYLKSGIHSGDYRLPDIVSVGVWKVVAKLHSNPQQSYSAEFQVKEYVLPSFEVKLTSVSPFFYVDSEELTVNIRATYRFGQEVNGTAYAVFGALQDGQKRSFPSCLQKVTIERGDGVVRLKRDHITETYRNIYDLVGSSIFVAVTVLTESGREMVEEELRGIWIVTSPYTITFKKTPKYFKAGMSIDVVVEVVNPDDTPAQGVAVVVDPGQVMGITAANGMARLSINTMTEMNRITITAKTTDPHILPHRQASATMVALPYTTKSNSYIHLVLNRLQHKLGENLRIYAYLARQESTQIDITYLILSRGQLVKYGRHKASSEVLISLTFLITKEMLPSFRVIAYYHTNDNEVVSDSVWVDLEDSCMGSLQLESTRPDPSYEPRKMFHLKITGDPEATVGLVAVDKGVYSLNNKHRLTQKKVWDIIEKYDPGCTPGGGKDSMSVFYDAGLLFESTASSTPHRADFKCPGTSRKKRASTSMEINTSSDVEDNSYMDSSEIVSRTSFPESWLWSDIKLPPCPQETPNCDTTSFVKNVPLQDSITTWQIVGISLSTTHGICVADPVEVIIRKEFFIDLILPYSAVRGERLEIKAILHNYRPDRITVRVDLFEEEHVCSSASKRGRYRQQVIVEPQATQSVPFIIIPMKEGRFLIQVKAAVKDLDLNDGVMKVLQVVPQGVLIKSRKILTLDPSNKGGKHEEIINSEIPPKDFIQNLPVSTHISVTGAEQIGPLVENPISATSMGSLIYQPSGNGEANMIHMTLPVTAAMYLDKTNQWETVGFQKRNEALQHIKLGYQRELTYRKNDGSFAAYPSRQSSTWLTAYVAKVFAVVNYLVATQSSYICDAVKFLLVNAQQSDGTFREVGMMIHGEMMGDVLGTDSDVSMTAFCLIAIQKSKTPCAATVYGLQSGIDNAVAYLEMRLPALINPYAVAMTSYALANENKLNREILYNFVSPELSHWPVSKGHVYTLEATAYALLALVQAKAFEEARPVVSWLKQQPKVGGGYGSTQATMMVHQAVAEYWTNARESEYDLDVNILLPGRSKPDRFNFNRENFYTTRTFKIHSINKNVTVTARGTGRATLTMVSLYYALPGVTQSDCQKFNLSVQLLPVNVDEDEKIYKLRIDVMYNDNQRDATLSVLEIGLLTGFTANTNDLDLQSKGRARTIAKYEMNTVLSERGSVIIYLNKVSHTRPEEVTFRIHQQLKVGVLQPAAVSVYEYYDMTSCVKFYHPEMRNGELLQPCKNDECRCTEEYCRMQKKAQISNDERKAVAYGSTSTGITDFVYKIRVEEFKAGLSSDIFKARIVEVIKEGSVDPSPLNKLRTFLSYQHCRGALDLRTGKTFFIMGSSTDIQRDEQNQSYQYSLGERTWIEYWPTQAECQTEEHRATCLGIEELVFHLWMYISFTTRYGMQES